MSCYNAIVLLSMYFLFSSSNSRATYFPHLEHIQLTITRWVKATFLFPLITWYVLISCTGWHFGRPQLPTLCRHWKDDFLHIATTPDAVKILRFTHLLSLGMWLGKDKSGSMKVARRRRHTVAVDKPWNQKSKACYLLYLCIGLFSCQRSLAIPFLEIQFFQRRIFRLNFTLFNQLYELKVFDFSFSSFHLPLTT